MDGKSRKIIFVIFGLILGVSFFAATLVFGAEFAKAAKEKKARDDRIATAQELREKSYTVDLARHEYFDEKDAELESEPEETTPEETEPETTTEAYEEEAYDEPEHYDEPEDDETEPEYYEEPDDNTEEETDPPEETTTEPEETEPEETDSPKETDPDEYQRPDINNDGWTYMDRPYHTDITVDDGSLGGGIYGASHREAFLLACLVSCEAGWAPYETQVMIADTVIYRAQLDYGGDIEAAIYAPGQFWTAGMDKYIENGPYQNAVIASQAALSGDIYGSTHYYYFWSSDYALSNWDWLTERGYEGEFIGGDDGDFFFN